MPAPVRAERLLSAPELAHIVYHSMFRLSSLAFQSLRVARAPILSRDKGKVSKWDVAWSLMRRNLKVRQTEALNMYTVGDWGTVPQMAVGGYSPKCRLGDCIDGIGGTVSRQTSAI